MNKGLFSSLFAITMTVFIVATVFAQGKQNQIKINEKVNYVSKRQDRSLTAIKQLITLYQKVSSDLRSEIMNIKSEQGNPVKNKANKAALNLAKKLDKFAGQLIVQKNLMENTKRSFKLHLKKIIKITEEAMADNQSDINFLIQMQNTDASNYAYAASQLSKREHDLYMELIRNLKD